MADTKLSALALGATAAYTYGIEGGVSKRYAADSIINVKTFGAVGDGVTNDTTAIQLAIDAAFGTAASPHGNSYYLNHPLYFPPGNYVTSSPLLLTAVSGGLIYGAGALDTKISNTGSGQCVFKTDDMNYTTVRDIGLQGGPGGNSVGFYLGGTGSHISITGNSFHNMTFGYSDTGLLLGADGFMGSETLVLACTFAGHATAGIRSANGNSLDNTIIGGGCSGSARGIYVSAGSLSTVLQFSCATNTIADIDIAAGAFPIIAGCRTESPNFVRNFGGSVSLIGCDHTGLGAFYQGNQGLGSYGLLFNCNSYFGTIPFGTVKMEGCSFNSYANGVTGAANNGSGAIRLTLSDAGLDIWATGDKIHVRGVGGVPGADGDWTITSINRTHIDLVGSTFSGTYTSGGNISAWDWEIWGRAGTTHAATIPPSQYRNRRWSQTSNLTLGGIQSGCGIDNIGATGTVTITLPDATTDGMNPGTKFGFYVGAAQTLSIKPAAGMFIRVGGVGITTVTTGTVSSNTVGNYIEFELVGGSEGRILNISAVLPTTWVATSVIGTWTVT